MPQSNTSLIRSDIQAIGAYHVPDSTGLMKLDAVENPFSLPDDLRKAWATMLADTSINRYPDADMQTLRSKIAARDGVLAEQVLLGNGSDEIIQTLLMAAADGACVVPTPSFVMYNVVSLWVERKVVNVSLSADFTLDVDKSLEACAENNASIAFLACPNNPTGNMWPAESIKKIADNFKGLLVIDEAYFPFTDTHYLDFIGDNILVLRTFSKMGFAGLRLGYLLGDEALISQLNKVRMPYNVNTLTQASALFLLDHSEVFDAQVSAICKEREVVFEALGNMKGVEVFASQTNFFLFRVADSSLVFKQLLDAGILIKNMHGAHCLLDNCLRVTVGTKEENKKFLEVMKGIMA